MIRLRAVLQAFLGLYLPVVGNKVRVTLEGSKSVKDASMQGILECWNP